MILEPKNPSHFVGQAVEFQLQALLSSDHHSRRLPKAVGGPMAGMSPLDGQEQTKSVSESMAVAVGSYWLSEPRSRIK